MSDSCCAPSRPPTAGRPGAVPMGEGRHPGAVVDLSGGTFRMGYEGPLANPDEGEGPVRDVTVGPFAITATTVTVEQFAAFVAATDHRTTAEADGWSFVFDDFVDHGPSARGRALGAEWWVAVDDADWRNPHGPTSHLPTPGDHPVVHVSWHDAAAYCAWVGGRLPTESEWEFAARGGLEDRIFPWGDRWKPDGNIRATIWEGRFPHESTKAVAERGTVPVTRHPPNGYGLHHAVGNVWEWTADDWSVRGRVDPEQRVRKGGSYLCHDSYCNRYRVAARDHSRPDDTTGNIGFRVAWAGGTGSAIVRSR